MTRGQQSGTATAAITAFIPKRGIVNPRMAQSVLAGANLAMAIAALLRSMHIH